MGFTGPEPSTNGNGSDGKKNEQEKVQEEYRQKRLQEIAREERKTQVAKRLQEIAKGKEQEKPKRREETNGQKSNFYNLAGRILEQYESRFAQAPSPENDMDTETKLMLQILEYRTNLDGTQEKLDTAQAQAFAQARLQKHRELYQTLQIVFQAMQKTNDKEQETLGQIKEYVSETYQKRRKELTALEITVPDLDDNDDKVQEKKKEEKRVEKKEEKNKNILIRNAAKHRQVKKLQKEIKKLQKELKTAQTDASASPNIDILRQQLDALEALREEIQTEQVQEISQYKFKIENREIGIIDLIHDKRDDIKKIIDTNTNLLPSEKARLRELLEIEDLGTLEPEGIEALIHPETIGRLNLIIEFPKRQAQEGAKETNNISTMLEESFAQFEIWRLTGNAQERLQGAGEDFYNMLLMLDAQEFSELDMYTILEGYGFLNVDYKKARELDSADINKAIEFNRDFENNEMIKELIDNAKRIKRQFEATSELLNPREDLASKHVHRQNEILSQISQSIGENENLLQSIPEKSISIKQTATGMSIVINQFELNDDTMSLIDLLAQMGITDKKAIEDIKEHGLGATIQKDQLTKFYNYLNTELPSQEGVEPSVQILILPNKPLSQYNEHLLANHEMSDYLTQELFIGSKFENASTEEIETIRALRELGSRILDGRTGAINDQEEILKTYLQNLYISSENNSDNQELSELIIVIEKIIQSERAKHKDEFCPFYYERGLRNRLLNEINSHLLSLRTGSSIRIAELTQKLLGKYLETTTKIADNRWNPDIDRKFADVRHDKFIFSTPNDSSDDTIELLNPLTDSTNQYNKAFRMGATLGQFDTESRYPQLYGHAYKSTLNQTWAYADESFRGVPANILIPGFAKIPILNRLVGWMPLPIPASYPFKRGVGAGLYRSSNPRVRELAQYLGGRGADYLGSKPEKILGQYVNKKWEQSFKTYAPGYLASRAIPEGRDHLPQSLMMDTYEGLGHKFINWAMAVGQDAGIHPIDMMRIIGKSQLGITYEFSPSQSGQPMLQLKQNLAGLRAYKSITDINPKFGKEEILIKKLIGKKFNFKKDDKGNFVLDGKNRYIYEKKDYVSPYKGLFESFSRAWRKKGASEAQKQAADFFKLRATRTQTERARGGEKYKWMDFVGSKYRDALSGRDAFIGLQTLGKEAAFFQNFRFGDKTIKEEYSLYSLANLLHRADQMIGDKDRAWYLNTTGKPIQMTFTERGQPKTVTILPDEPLVDLWGNLIPTGVHLKKDSDDKVFINANGTVELDNTKEDFLKDNAALWQRLVGDRWNPQYRYIKLNSEEAKQEAIAKFGGNDDIDMGFDEDNVILRADAIKEAIFNNRFPLMEDQLLHGIPPDRRYKMEYREIERGKREKEACILFQDANVFVGEPDENGNYELSEQFKDAYVKAHIEALKMLRGVVLKDTEKEQYTKDLLDTLGDSITRRELSTILEKLLGMNAGRRMPDVDRELANFIEIDTNDSSWDSPYRYELEGLPPWEAEEVRAIMEVITGGFGALEDRYNKGQNFLQQWQTAMYNSQVYERIAYDKIGYFTGMKQHIKWWTNIGLVANGILLAVEISSPLAGAAFFYTFLTILLTRILAKPWAEKQEKAWKARRIKAIETSNKIKDLDAVFQKPLAGEAPVEAENNKMHLTMEQVIYWLEDMAKTEAPEDWFPKDDRVINGLGAVLGRAKEKLDELAKAA